MTSCFRLLALAIMAMAVPVASVQAQPADVAEHKDVSYGPHEKNKLDVYVPKSDKPLPLVVWIHGGGWQGGNKGDGGPAKLLLSHGFAVAATNYRLTDAGPFPAQAEDVRAAIRHLRANAKKYNIDPDHIGVWGASAGGHLVALLGTQSDVEGLDGDAKADGNVRVQAVVDWFGPSDITRFNSGPAASANGPIAKLLGGPPSEKTDVAKLASPLLHVTKDDAPTLIFHGDKDPLVPLEQSQLLADALKKAGVECELVVIEGAGHGGKDFMSDANRNKVIAFMNKHLKGQ